AGVRVNDRDEREESTGEQHRVELYAPVHEYSYRMSGRVTGPVTGVLEVRQPRGDRGGLPRAAARSRPGELIAADSRPGSAGRWLDDREAPVHRGSVAPIAREGGEDTVGELPEPVALGLVLDDGRVHRDPAEDEVRMGSQVVIPGRVSRAARVRRHDGD